MVDATNLNAGPETRRKVRLHSADKMFYLTITVFLCLAFLAVVFPLMNVVGHSLSSPEAVARGQVWFFPVDFTTFAYEQIIVNKQLMTGFYNSLIYASFGTMLNIFLTVLAAYPLSRKDFFGRHAITIFFAFTMLFNGGMIPRYLIVKSLGLIDTRWAMILPEAIMVWYVIIARTFFQHTIPEDLYDAAEIDGASDLNIMAKVVVPLSGPIMAVLALFYAVGHWNRYFDALIFLRSDDLWNLQLVLRNVIMSAAATLDQERDLGSAMRAQERVEVLKYAVIVFAALPVMLLYPFIQRYFVKGVMIGSIKG